MASKVSHIGYSGALLFVINLVLIKSEKALLFDLEQTSVIQKEERDETETVCHNCAIARPSLKDDEIDYNYKYSVGKRVLFLERIYGPTERMNKIELPAYNGFFQASVIFNKNLKLIEIGYEIHDINNVVDSSKLINKKDEFLSLYPSSFSETPQPKLILSKYLKPEKRKIPSEQSTLRFIWLPVLLIDFNLVTMSTTRIYYNSGSGIHQKRNNCNQFYIGEEFYKRDTHRSAYSYGNQRLLLTGKKDPPRSVSNRGSQCGQKYGCLVQHQIIPSYYLHSQYGARAICTPLNTVPIWESIVNRINLVDKYLYAMSQIWKPYITITNGFHGIFKPSEKYFEKSISGQELFLDRANRNIPVPMIFYKIVEYRVIDVPRESKNRHYAVIVIHNDPTSDVSEKRICAEDNTLGGWQDIQNSDLRSGLTYVCAFSKNVIRELNLLEKESEGNTYDLRLNDFLQYFPEHDWFLYVNKIFEISDKVKELFPNEENSAP